MIITVSLNPALDKTIAVDGVNANGVNRVLASRVDAGGKGINVAKTVKALGGEPLAMGIVGGSGGVFIQQQLEGEGIRHDFVISEHPTRTNLKVSDRLRQTMTEFNEPGAPVTDVLLEQVWEKLDKTAQKGDTVVIAGTNPPGMQDDVIAGWIEKLNAKGVVTALDTIGESMRQGIAAKPSVIKPNINELADLCGEDLHYIRDIIASARQITQQGVERVVVSMGGDGALFVTKDRILRGYGLKIQLGSTVGSGDAMMAAILHYLEQGCSWEETAKWSIATSAANAMCEGSQTPDMEQIKALVDQVVIETMV